MVGKELISGLKKSNVSNDAEKTKQRVKELFLSASKTDKIAIEQLSGLGRATVQKAYGTGGLSAKLAVSIAQILNVNPLYLTGEMDDKGECTDEVIRDFLLGKDESYTKIVAETLPIKGEKKSTKATSNRGTRTKKEDGKAKGESSSATDQPAADDKSVETSEPEAAVPDASVPNKAFIDGMTEEQMILLMRAIILKAESGIPECVDQAYRLKVLLSS